MNKVVKAQVTLPIPRNLTYSWNFGRILGVLLGSQILTGFFLRMHYTADLRGAYARVVYICRDVPGGWIFRVLHANGASFFFFFIFLHIGRGLYYQRYLTQPYVWSCGVLILFLRMATAFLGYVLPWGQMSLWGATVITNLISAVPYIGPILVEWIWGSFRVGNPTLHRFYSLHFVLPFVIAFIILVHIYFLHRTGSTNPLGEISRMDMVVFVPYYRLKDLVGFLLVFILLFALVFYAPYNLGDPENFIPANSIVTPVHIIPEWYFLFAYAILRVIPRKLGGVLALVSSIAILFLLPGLRKWTRASAFNPAYQLRF